MALLKIFLLLTVLACVIAHEDNTQKLEDLASELENIKTSQKFAYSALDALETNLNALFSAAVKLKEEEAKTKSEPKPRVEKERKLKHYAKRLTALEENVRVLKSLVDAEGILDDKLIELTTYKLQDVDDLIAETKTLTDAAKDEVKVSLGRVEPTLKSVKETADKRNFNLGGTVFYGGHGSACIEGFYDCGLSESECRAGQCQCLPGLSYDRKSQSCVEECESYGLDFELVPNRVIRGNNSAVFNNVSLDECRQHCVEATHFVCITFDYFNWYDSCYLSEVTKLQEENNWEYNAAGTHFHRNCN